MLGLGVNAVRARRCGFAFVLSLPLVFSCGGTVLDVGGGRDGGRDACAVGACGSGQVWDALTCGCVTPPPACQPQSCPGGETFDTLQCACVVKRDGGSGDACAVAACGSGQAWDALTCSCVTPSCQPPAGGCPAGETFDAVQCVCIAPTLDAGPEGDAGGCGLVKLPSCCVLNEDPETVDASTGTFCTLSSTPSMVGEGPDPCAPFCLGGFLSTEFNGGVCPVACDDAGVAPCAPGTCRMDPSVGNTACLPPGGPIANVLPDGGPALGGCCACGTDGFCSDPCT